MTPDTPQKPEEQASWSDFFKGFGQRMAHTWHCLKNPAYVGRVAKASLSTAGMTVATLALVGIVVATKGRALALDVVALAGLGMTVPGWRGVGRQWEAAGELSQKIWDRSFPASTPAPPMPKMLPGVFLFGSKPSAKSAFAATGEKPQTPSSPVVKAPSPPQPPPIY